MKTWFLVLLILLAGCAHQLTVEPDNTHILQKTISTPNVNLQISTDSPTYGSGQQMKIVVTITTDQAIQNTHLLLYGIKSKYDVYKLNQDYWLNLTTGARTLNYDFITPACSSCSGVFPGDYQITAELILGEERLAAANTTINIQG